MANWRERMLNRARSAFRRNRPLAAVVYINIWAHRRSGAVHFSADVFTDLDDAAADAARPNLYVYSGTVATGPLGCDMLDLSRHGEGVLREDAEQARDEVRHRRGLTAPPGRAVT